jgi:pimeloyl-ACP methyl ester carboxylesterase
MKLWLLGRGQSVRPLANRRTSVSMKSSIAAFAGRLPAFVWAAAWLLLAAPAFAGGSPHPDFEVSVSGQGRPVIFIPGLATPGAIWQPVVDQLHGAYQCHVISPAGFGKVKPTGSDPLLPRLRDELIEYIRSEKLDHPVIVGHSLGGFLALWIAETAPDVPGSLIIVDALPYLPAMLNPSATPETMRSEMAPMIAQMSASSQEVFDAIEKQSISTMITSPANLNKVAALCAGSDPKTTARALLELTTNDLRPGLGKITVPALVLVALADKVSFNPKEAVLANYRKQYEGLRGARFQVFGDARHFIMVDDLPGFMNSLQDGLKAPPVK